MVRQITKGERKPAVLVTGGAGYIGSHICHRLSQRGYQPVVLDNLSRGHAKNVRWGECVVGELDDASLLDALSDRYAFQAVIHCAGLISVGESFQRPDAYFKANAVQTATFLDRLIKNGVKKIVFSSTAALYGNPHSVPINEDHPLNPVSPYGWSKLFTEKMLSFYAESFGLKVMALRYFNAAGAETAQGLGEEHDPETHLIPLALQAAYRPVLDPREGLQVFGEDYPTPDGSCIRDYVHVADLATAHVLALPALEQQGVPFQAMNLGTGIGTSVLQVIKMVEQCTGRRVVHASRPRRQGDAPTLVADASLSAKVLQWTPEHSSLEEIVESAKHFFLSKKRS